MTRRQWTAVLMAGASSLVGLGQAAAQDAASDSPTAVEELVVIGSHIPRVQVEGPAPITVITSDEIKANGFASVPDVLRAVTQNGGETQSQQSFSGASFTPGAQQVDLRGLGPNHTLVLVNGRRIADFPLPFQGRSNFTDVSNLPLGMIEKVEVLSGSASAVYGSDAISGVVNFQLKENVDGVTADYRYGFLEHGGGESHRFTLVGGWSGEKFHSVFGVEVLDQEPLWAYDRERQDSTADEPGQDHPIGRRAYLRIEPWQDVYIDPGEATCARLAGQNFGTTYYASRPRWGLNGEPGRYCGTNEAIGFGTILSQRRGVSFYGSMGYDLNENVEFFADVLAGYSKVKLFPDVLDWQYQDANGSEDGIFYNRFARHLDSWYRQFSPEEMGGLENGMIENTQKTISITPGVKGKIADVWNYEASFNHTEYRATVSWPEIIAEKANALFLGRSYGISPINGYEMFYADPERLYTPLTRAEYDSIATRAVYHPRSQNDNAQLIVNRADLFNLPAGPVGFAAVGEFGVQSYDLRPDPLALTNYYYGLRDSDGKGDRTHWGVGYEFRAPLLETLQISTAGRYDSFKYAESTAGKFTYNGGIEFRPWKILLLRGAYGTGFRAPDLHYVYSGEGNTHPSGTDYFRCRTEEPDVDIGDCSYADTGIVSTRIGNRALKPETSTSINFGFVLQPFRGADISIDYFKVKLKNGVLDMSNDTLLRTEADCRLGDLDIASPTCVDAIARVLRYPADNPINPGGLIGTRVNPVNLATEETSGLDFAAHYKLPTDFGVFSFSAGYTYVFNHESQQYPGDPIVDQLAFDSGYYIPRSKGNASITWAIGKWTTTLHGQRLSKLPNYDEDAYTKAQYLFNASVQYDITDRARVSLTVDNLFDTGPVNDPTYSGYPYYDISWYDTVGRSYYLQLTYKLGGAPL
jgi:iron complex outermembrane recepter protein